MNCNVFDVLGPIISIVLVIGLVWFILVASFVIYVFSKVIRGQKDL